MDEAHLLAAVRYVAMNLVVAGLVAQPADWPWSSTKAHLARHDNGLITVKPELERLPNFAAFVAAEPEPAAINRLLTGQSIGRPPVSDKQARSAGARPWKASALPPRGPQPKRISEIEDMGQ